MECWWFWHQPHRDLSHSGPERGKCVTIWPTAGEENRKQISLYSLSLCYPSMPPSPRWEKYWESKHSLRVTASIKYQVAENGKRHLWSFLEHVSWKRKHRPKLRWSKTNVPSPAEEKKKTFKSAITRPRCSPRTTQDPYQESPPEVWVSELWLILSFRLKQQKQ